MKRAPSLVRRLWFASAIAIPLLIGFSTYALNRAYVRSLDSAEYEALVSQIYALLAIAEPTDAGLSMPALMANPRFETPESGLYARIRDTQGKLVWQSSSLASSTVELDDGLPTAPGGMRESWFLNGKLEFRSVSLTTIWELNGRDQQFSFEVAHDQQNKVQEIRQYRRSLLIWLSGMAIMLAALQVFITYWGMRPLKSLAREIGAIERGDTNTLGDAYPVEIQPVTRSLNKLLASESAQRERYKNSLADLAHSLKTPLSVVRSQLTSSEKDRLVDEQVERMSAIITHQLKRASAQVQTLYGPETPVRSIVERLVVALSKVYQDKAMHIDVKIEPDLAIPVNEDDSFEMLGNVVENAFKYGESIVSISSAAYDDAIEIVVEDDGPGVDTQHASEILARGARGDTGTSGQGIGLAVAVDILSSYNGGLAISQASIGGASFRIRLPSTAHTRG